MLTARRGGAAVLLAVVLLASFQAGRAYGRFLGEHRGLWYSSTHDRSEHFLYALEVATALRGADVAGFAATFSKAAIWPPLHGLLAGGVLAVGGPDYRLAVLPSLFAWIGCAVFAYLLTRRCLPDGGVWAGLVPVAFVLASPLHHGFAVDVMLESTGAALTLFCLYCYVRVVQDGEVWAWRGLGLGLTAMTLNKYNYYVLVVVALVAAELTARGRFYLDRGRALLTDVDWRGLARRELRHPLVWLIGLALLAAVVIGLRGRRPLLLGQTPVNVYPPTNVVQLAYWLLFARLALAFYPWRPSLARLGERPRQLVLWHVVPVALYLLLPKHFLTFAWYVSPANRYTHQSGTFLDGVRDYAAGAAEHYHAGPWSLVLAVTLFGVALACCRRLRPGAAAVLWLGVLAAGLTCKHPNHQVRFLHSWLAVVWVGAGVGAAAWLALLPRRRAFTLAAAAIAVGVVAAHGPEMAAARRSPIGGPRGEAASLLDVTEAVFAEGEGGQRLGLLPAVPVASVTRWGLLLRPAQAGNVEYHRHGFGPPGEANRQAFRRWVETTRCDAIVYLEPAGYAIGVAELGEVRPFLEVRDLLGHQGRFRLAKQQEFPRQGCRMLVYRRVKDELAGR